MEILELATDLKGARDEINRLRADYALLADDYMQLLGDVERLRAELAECRAALELIAAPQRSDGSWNRDREACRQVAQAALAAKEE